MGELLIGIGGIGSSVVELLKHRIPNSAPNFLLLDVEDTADNTPERQKNG